MEMDTKIIGSIIEKKLKSIFFLSSIVFMISHSRSQPCVDVCENQCYAAGLCHNTLNEITGDDKFVSSMKRKIYEA